MFVVYINCLRGLRQHNVNSEQLAAASNSVSETEIFVIDV